MRELFFVLFLFHFAPAEAGSSVRSEGGRFWIDCRSAPLEEVLRKIAEISPMELWLDEGVSGKRVTARVEGLPLKDALAELFEDVNVNYVLYSDPANPGNVAKVYAGSGGDAGRLVPAPTVAAAESVEGEMPPELPPELDPENLLGSSEVQETLSALKEFLERQNEQRERTGEPTDVDSEQALDEELPDDLPAELQELLKNIPQFPRGAFTPGLESQDAGRPAAPEEKKDPKK